MEYSDSDETRSRLVSATAGLGPASAVFLPATVQRSTSPPNTVTHSLSFPQSSAAPLRGRCCHTFIQKSVTLQSAVPDTGGWNLFLWMERYCVV